MPTPRTLDSTFPPSRVELWVPPPAGRFASFSCHSCDRRAPSARRRRPLFRASRLRLHAFQGPRTEGKGGPSDGGTGGGFEHVVGVDKRRCRDTATGQHPQDDAAVLQERLLKPLSGFCGMGSEMSELAEIISRVACAHTHTHTHGSFQAFSGSEVASVR